MFGKKTQLTNGMAKKPRTTIWIIAKIMKELLRFYNSISKNNKQQIDKQKASPKQDLHSHLVNDTNGKRERLKN